jgi:hypothetical protein
MARVQIPVVVFFNLVLSFLVVCCGPDKALLSETKLDRALREMVESIGENAPPQRMSVTGKCTSVIDGLMRSDLIGAGAHDLIMERDSFTADIMSDDVFHVAALEFVVQLQLSGSKK